MNNPWRDGDESYRRFTARPRGWVTFYDVVHAVTRELEELPHLLHAVVGEGTHWGTIVVHFLAPYMDNIAVVDGFRMALRRDLPAHVALHITFAHRCVEHEDCAQHVELGKACYARDRARYGEGKP